MSREKHVDKAHAAYMAAAEKRRNARFEDYGELIELGYTPEEACVRLGLSLGTFARQAYRNGRPDIGAPLSRLEGRMRGE